MRWDPPETPEGPDAEPAAPQNEREVDVFLTGFDVGWAAARRRYGPEGAATAARLAHEFERGVAVGAALHRYYRDRVEAGLEPDAAGECDAGQRPAPREREHGTHEGGR